MSKIIYGQKRLITALSNKNVLITLKNYLFSVWAKKILGKCANTPSLYEKCKYIPDIYFQMY